MRAYLQFYDTTWKDCGTVRPLTGNDFKITSIVGRDSENTPECIGYKVTVNSRIITIHADLLDEDEWNFRLYDPVNDTIIDLYTHKYLIDYDGLIKRNNIEYHTIRLEFEIGISSYESYTEWAAV